MALPHHSSHSIFLLMFVSPTFAFTGIPLRQIYTICRKCPLEGEAPSSSGMAEARRRRSPEGRKALIKGQRGLEEGKDILP